MIEDDEKYQRAQARIRRIRSFYSNVITFVLVNILLIVINLMTNPRDLWFYWVTLIWGFILIVQALNTFTIRDRFLGEEWEKKKIKEMLDKEKDESKPDQK